MAFSFCLFCGRHLPRGIAAGIFLFRRQEIARQKNTHFFMAGERGNTSKKTEYKKTNDTMLIIKRPISSALVFCTLGRNGALVFSAAFRRRLFHLYLFFHSNVFPGFFIFPCFLQGSAGGQSGARTPCQQSLLWEYHPRFRPPDAPKNKWKNDGMTGKNKCPKQPKKQAPALLVKLRRSAGTPCRGRTQPAKSSKAVPPRLTLKKSRDEPAVLELVRDTNVKMCSVQQDDRASV